MKKSEAEAINRYMIKTWIEEKNPQRDEFGNLQFYDYLNCLEERRPDATDFRCRGGAHFQLERWFDTLTGQTWTQ